MKLVQLCSLSVVCCISASTHAFNDEGQFQAMLKGLCASHPGVRIQQLEVDSLEEQRSYTAHKDWMPSLTISTGPQYGDGEPVGFFAIDNADQPVTPGPNGEIISAKRGSGFFVETKADLQIPIYKDSHWIGQDSPDERLIKTKLSYEQIKIQQVYQENVLQLIDTLISANEVVEKESLLQKLRADATAQLDIAKNAAQAKLIDRSELLMVEENVLSVNGELKKMAKTRQYLDKKLAFYTGDTEMKGFPRLSLQRLPNIATLNDLIAEIQAENTDLALQEQLIVVAEKNYEKSRRQNGIKFGLKSTFQSVGDDDLNNEKHLATTGLNIEVPLDDLVTSRGESRYWVIQVQKEKEKLAYLRKNLRITLAETYDNYQQELVNLDNMHASLSRAQQEFQINEELFSKGRISSAELIESRSKIYETELSKLDTYAKLWMLNYKLQPASQWTCNAAGQ